MVREGEAPRAIQRSPALLSVRATASSWEPALKLSVIQEPRTKVCHSV